MYCYKVIGQTDRPKEVGDATGVLHFPTRRVMKLQENTLWALHLWTTSFYVNKTHFLFHFFWMSDSYGLLDWN